MWILPRSYIGGHHDLSDSTQCTPPSLEKIMPGKVHFFRHYHKLPRSGKKKFYCISFSVLLELVMVCVEGGEESSPRVTVTYLSRYGACKRWREIESRCGEHQPHWVVRRRNQSKKKKKRMSIMTLAVWYPTRKRFGWSAVSIYSPSWGWAL